MVSEVKKKKMDIFFNKLTELKKDILKLRVDVTGLKEEDFKLMEEQFKKCNYLIMLCEDGKTETIYFK